jgi:hypothetical protein
VKSRLTAWLSALLLFNAVFGVPVVRVVTNRVSCSVVYSEQRRDRGEQFAERPEAAPAHSPVRLSATRRERAAVPILDSHLFQRPPPALS